MELLKKLTAPFAMPGWEAPLRQLLLEELRPHAHSLEVDRLGSILAKKEGAGPPLVLCAHMDEPGLMITHIDSDGGLRFAPWGLEPAALPGRRVLAGEKRLPGVISLKPPHLQSPAEQERFSAPGQLYADMGAASREEALALVQPGEYMGFDMPFTRLENGLVNARALASRSGCAVVLRAFREDTGPRAITAIFCTQRESGSYGAALAAKQAEGTDVLHIYGLGCAPDSETARRRSMALLGRGPVLVQDASCPPDSARRLRDLAAQKAIPLQVVGFDADYADGIRFQMAGAGKRVLNVGVPIRHKATTAALMDPADYEHTTALVKAWLEQGE